MLDDVFRVLLSPCKTPHLMNRGQGPVGRHEPRYHDPVLRGRYVKQTTLEHGKDDVLLYICSKRV